MKKKQNSKISIDNVSGDVVISKSQKGGITSHQTTVETKNKKNKTFFNNRYILLIGFIASTLTILAYFGLQPTKLDKTEIKNVDRISKLDSSKNIIDTITKKDTIKKFDKVMKRNEEKSKKEKPISIGDVAGDVVISQNQTGGITAHSVNINTPQCPEWELGKSEKIHENEWRTIFSAKGIGNLAYYNWNVLLTLNTEVIRREEIKCSVGPWMPLNVQGGNLTAKHFFIGFSEFKPGQYFSLYLYSKEPIKIQKVDVIGN